MSMLKSITDPYTGLESWIYDRVVAGAVTDMKAAMWAELEQGLPENVRVLDVGCGGGQLALAIAQEKPSAHVTGIDLSAEQVGRARKRAQAVHAEERLQFVQGSALDLPFEDGAFDAVLSVASSKHWPDPARGLRECARVLAPGGRLVVVEADRGCRFEDAAAFVNRFRLPGLFKPFALFGFRTWVAGQSLDLEEARAFAAPLPLEDVRVDRIAGTPGLVIVGTRAR